MNDGSSSARRVTIYTDGACSGNPGPGGWAVLFMLQKNARFVSGFDPATTNNRMELSAAIRALEELDKRAKADLYTDSRYLLDGITKWIHLWRKNNWQTSNKKPVVSQDLWQKLIEQVETHAINWIWTKGHASDEYNHFVDALAKATILERQGIDVRMTVPELDKITRLSIVDLREILWPLKIN
jgi:ribonuclease HI